VKNTTGFVYSTLASITLAIVASGVAVAQTPNAGSTPSALKPEPVPAWAYPWDPDFKTPPADDAPHRLPGSTASFRWAQARDLFFSPDWHPEDHLPLPAIVPTPNLDKNGFPVSYQWFDSSTFESRRRRDPGRNNEVTL